MNCSTSHRKRNRNTAISIFTFALSFGLPGVIGSSHAQSYRSGTDRIEINMTQTTAVKSKNEETTDKNQIRPFRVNIQWENRGVSLISAGDQKSAEIKLPVAITVFPDEVVRAQERWARRAFPNLIYFHEVDRGGHFAAWEYPELFAEEIRIAFRSLR